MIPDKIFTDNRGVYSKLPIFSQADANIEYIRKDALLEWLESKIKDLPRRGFVNCVATLSYKDVVEHINKM